ncbi:hypothetical protein LSCM1_05626 [Leishmania martiniquensis]|uniref:Uncharacterized protein n=1 Tax=Leishmania martiniquensis TaxID=1580590 RepID=A0A836GGH7_9TRYP|nr:hypothetical protein LSCM1_05626 [Leishmania martiniquensis]
MQFLFLATSRIDNFHRRSPAHMKNASKDDTAFSSMKPTRAGCRARSRFVGSRPVQGTWFLLVCLSTGMAVAIQPRYDMGAATYRTLHGLPVVCLAFFLGAHDFSNRCLWAHQGLSWLSAQHMGLVRGCSERDRPPAGDSFDLPHPLDVHLCGSAPVALFLPFFPG